MKALVSILTVSILLSSCDLIRMKRDNSPGTGRKAVARVNDVYLYQDELAGIVSDRVSKEDSATRVQTYVDSWIRKQLLISQAMKTIDINEAEVERKVLEYRYTLIGYEYQNFYINKNLDDSVSAAEVESYYKAHIDNFILKQNIVKGTFIVVPKGAPRTNRLKDLIYSSKEKDITELRSFCLSFSSAYHIADSSWMEFDKLVVGSPLAEIPNKVQFLKSNPYYETSDAESMYFLKIDEYKISDNASPLEFVKAEIRNIILNKRKVELAKKLEDDVYDNAAKRKDFEVYN
ncbi:MAG TPA: peptidyl-prolyl cis-trans isomerase [Cyclobacteriaceae bacterium]